MSTLERLPILNAYNEQTAFNQQRSLGNLAELSKFQEFQQSQLGAQKQAKFMSDLSQLGDNPSHEQVIGLAVKSGLIAPKDIATLMQSGDLKREGIAASKEQGLARLQQAAQQSNQMFQFRTTQAKTQQDRDAALQEYRNEQSDIARARLQYDTGTTLPARERTAPLSSIGAPQQGMQVPASQAPQGAAYSEVPTYAAASGQASGTGTRATGDSVRAMALQSELASETAKANDPNTSAEDRAMSQQNVTAITKELGGGATLAAPVAPPVAAPRGPAADSNLDARDLKLQNMTNLPPALQARVAPSIAEAEAPKAPTSAIPAMPPEIASAPKKVQDQWLLQQSKSTTTSSGDFTKKGDDYLQSLSPQDQQLVKKVAAYDIDPKTFSTRGGQRERIMSMVAQFDPSFDQKEYNTRYNAINRFATGPQGNTVRSLNVAIEHMDTARRLGKALENGDIPAFNALGLMIAKETGKAAPTNFDSVKNILADEVVKGILGGQSALQDRQEMASKIRASSSPAQLGGVLDSWAELLGGQLKGLEKQYTGSTGRSVDSFRQRFMTPRALDALKSASNPAAASPSYPTATDAKGNKVQFKDGAWQPLN